MNHKSKLANLDEIVFHIDDISFETDFQSLWNICATCSSNGTVADTHDDNLCYNCGRFLSNHILQKALVARCYSNYVQWADRFGVEPVQPFVLAMAARFALRSRLSMTCPEFYLYLGDFVSNILSTFLKQNIGAMLCWKHTYNQFLQHVDWYGWTFNKYIPLMERMSIYYAPSFSTQHKGRSTWEVTMSLQYDIETNPGPYQLNTSDIKEYWDDDEGIEEFPEIFETPIFEISEPDNIKYIRFSNISNIVDLPSFRHFHVMYPDHVQTDQITVHRNTVHVRETLVLRVYSPIQTMEFTLTFANHERVFNAMTRLDDWFTDAFHVYFNGARGLMPGFDFRDLIRRPSIYLDGSQQRHPEIVRLAGWLRQISLMHDVELNPGPSREAIIDSDGDDVAVTFEPAMSDFPEPAFYRRLQSISENNDCVWNYALAVQTFRQNGLKMPNEDYWYWFYNTDRMFIPSYDAEYSRILEDDYIESRNAEGKPYGRNFEREITIYRQLPEDLREVGVCSYNHYWCTMLKHIQLGFLGRFRHITQDLLSGKFADAYICICNDLGEAIGKTIHFWRGVYYLVTVSRRQLAALVRGNLLHDVETNPGPSKRKKYNFKCGNELDAYTFSEDTPEWKRFNSHTRLLLNDIMSFDKSTLINRAAKTASNRKRRFKRRLGRLLSKRLEKLDMEPSMFSPFKAEVDLATDLKTGIFAGLSEIHNGVHDLTTYARFLSSQGIQVNHNVQLSDELLEKLNLHINKLAEVADKGININAPHFSGILDSIKAFADNPVARDLTKILLVLLVSIFSYSKVESKLIKIMLTLAQMGIALNANDETSHIAKCVSVIIMCIPYLHKEATGEESDDLDLSESSGDSEIGPATWKATLLSSILGGVYWCIYKKNCEKEDWFLKLLKDIGEVPKIGKGLGYTYDWILGSINKFINYIAEAINCPNLARPVGASPKLNEFHKKYLAFTCDYRAGMAINGTNRDRLCQLEMEGKSLLNEIERSDQFALNAMLRDIENYSQLFSAANCDKSGPRIPAMGVCFHGRSGIGKSTNLLKMMNRVSEGTMSQTEWEVWANNFNDCIFNWAFEQEFWEGYSCQFHVLMDDVGQLRDSAATPDPAIFGTIRMMNMNAFQVNMAHLNLKGANWFRSRIVWGTTNVRVWDIKSILCAEAFWRRWLCEFLAVPKLEYCTDDSPKGSDVDSLWNRELDRSKVKWTTTMLKTLKKVPQKDGSVKVEEVEELCDIPMDDILEYYRYDASGTKKGKRGEEVASSGRILEGPFSEAQTAEIIIAAYKKNELEGQSLINYAKHLISESDKRRRPERAVITADPIKQKWTSLGFPEVIFDKLAEVNKWTKDRWLELDTRDFYKAYEEFVLLPFTEKVHALWKSPIVKVGLAVSAMSTIYLVWNLMRPWVLEESSYHPKVATTKGARRIAARKPGAQRLSMKTAGSAIDDDLRARRRKVSYPNMYTLSSISADEEIHYGSAMFVFERVFVVPRHFVDKMNEQYLDKGDFMIKLKRWFVDHTIEFPFSSIVDEVYAQTDDEECDVVAIRGPKGPVYPHADIRKHLLSNSDAISKRSILYAGLEHFDRHGRTVEFATTSWKVKTHRYGDEDCKWTAIDGYFGYIETKRGDCGCPLWSADSDQKEHKIIGFVTCSGSDQSNSKSVTGCARLNREFFDELHKDFVRTGTVHVNEIDNGDFDYESDLDLRMSTSDYCDAKGCRLSVNMPSQFMCYKRGAPFNQTVWKRSKIVRAPFYELLGPSKTAPAIVKPVVRDGVYVDPLHKSRSKYGKPMSYLNEKLVEDAARSYAQSFLRPLDPNSELPHILKYVDACKRLSRGKSAGYDWTVNGYTDKTKFFGKDGDFQFGGVHERKLRAKVKEDLDKLSKGIYPKYIFTDFIKDECLAKEKVDDVKSRMISGQPIELGIIINMYFGEFIDYLEKCKILNGCGIGLNVYSSDWHILWEYLNQKRCAIDADQGKYDAKYNGQILLACLIVVEEFYKRNSTERDRQIRRTLIEGALKSMHIGLFGMEVIIYAIIFGMSSGWQLTTPFNTVGHNILSRYAIAMEKLDALGINHLQYQHGMIDFEEMENSVCIVCGGDDIILTFDEEYNISQEGLHNMFKTINYEFTDAEKTGKNYKHKKLIDCQFYKRRWKRCTLLGRMISPIDRASIEDSINYRKETGTDEEYILNCRAACVELAQRGEQDAIDKIALALNQKYAYVLVENTVDKLLCSMEKVVTFYK